MESTKPDYYETRYAYVRSANDAFYRQKAKRLMAAVQQLRKCPVQSFIDLGSGCGDLAHAVQSCYQIRVAGVEQDRRMVEKANQKETGNFYAGSVLFPLSELQGQFDVVSSFEVFEHLTHDQHPDALASYRHYGSKGSIGVILVPNAAHPLLGGFLAWSDYTHRTGFTPESLVQMLRENGFRTIKVHPWYNASRLWLLWFRKMCGFILGMAHKILSALVSSFPRSIDPAISDPIPFSTHLIAVFEINEAPR